MRLNDMKISIGGLEKGNTDYLCLVPENDSDKIYLEHLAMQFKLNDKNGRFYGFDDPIFVVKLTDGWPFKKQESNG